MILAGAELGRLAPRSSSSPRRSTSRTRASARARRSRRPTTSTVGSATSVSDFVGLLRLWDFVTRSRAARDRLSCGAYVQRELPLVSCAFESGRDPPAARRDRARAESTQALAIAKRPQSAPRTNAAGDADALAPARFVTGLLQSRKVRMPESRTYMGAKQTRLRDPSVVGARSEAAGVGHGLRARRDRRSSSRASRPRSSRSGCSRLGAHRLKRVVRRSALGPRSRRARRFVSTRRSSASSVARDVSVDYAKRRTSSCAPDVPRSRARSR